MKRLIICLFLSSFLTACAALQPEILTPKVSLTDLRLLNMGLFSQSYRLELNIQNPNAFPLPLNGLTYGLTLNNTPFAKGQANESVVIPSHGEKRLSLNVVSDLGSLLGQLKQWQTLGRSLNYKLDGELSLLNWAPKVPFNYQGDIKIN